MKRFLIVSIALLIFALITVVVVFFLVNNTLTGDTYTHYQPAFSSTVISA